jgi:hypothetical protein
MKRISGTDKEQKILFVSYGIPYFKIGSINLIWKQKRKRKKIVGLAVYIYYITL